MNIKWFRVYKVIPVPVFQVKSMKAGDAATRAVFVQVVKSQWDNEAIIRHELVHVKQFYRTLTLHGLLYALLKTYRFRAEAEAYAEQLRYVQHGERHDALNDYAEYLSSMYRLNKTITEAKWEILNYSFTGVLDS